MKPERQLFSTVRAVRSAVLRACVYICAALTAAVLLGILGYVIFKGVPHLTWELLSGKPSVIKGTIGILPNIINTLYLIAFTLLVALPLGVGAAIYLTEYATNRKLISAIEFACETLAGLPSILYGLVGMLFFAQMLGFQTSLLAGGGTLVVLIFPTIIRTTQESLKKVPEGYRHGSLSLGSGKWHMIRTVVLPCAMDGVVSGCILSVGRILGESAALLFTAGVGTVIATDIISAFQVSGGSLSVALYIYVSERGEFDVGFAIAALLIVLALIVNTSAKAAKDYFRKRTGVS